MLYADIMGQQRQKTDAHPPCGACVENHGRHDSHPFRGIEWRVFVEKGSVGNKCVNRNKGTDKRENQT